MTPREELLALRRLAELEAKAAGAPATPIPGGASTPTPAPTPPTGGASSPPATGMAERVMTGVMDPIVGAAQIAERTRIPGLLRKALGVESDMNSYVKERDANYVAPEGVDWARMGGNVANPLTFMGPAKAATAAMQATLAPTDAGDSDPMFLLKKAGQALSGGVFAKGTQALAKGVIPASADARALTGQGVRVTPGQAGGEGAKRFEDKIMSMPFVGDIVERARRRGAEDVQEKVIERATGIPGLRSVEDANAAVGSLYKKSVPHLTPNPQGIGDAAAAYNAALQNPELTADHAKILTGLWDKNFTNYHQLSGEGLKKLDSELGFLARKYTHGSPADQTLGDELRNITMALRGGLEQGLPPAETATLRQANSAYRGMVPINKAASTRADRLATPRALEKAIARQRNTDVTRLPDDQLLDPAVRAMTARIPDSGSPGRSSIQSPFRLLQGAAYSVPAMMAYSPAGTRVLTGQTKPQEFIEPYADPAIQALVAALRQ